MKKTVFIFALLIILLLLLFQISKYSIFSGNLPVELVISGIAILFFFIGVYLNKRSLNKNNNVISNVDPVKRKELDITDREYEVLKAIANGLSNQEIADQLFVTESTIKTHVSNLLIKLNAKRRTQAVQIAQELNII